MSLRGPYLLHLYQLLGINSAFVPLLKDGNHKYVRSIHDNKPVSIPLKVVLSQDRPTRTLLLR
jgi:hypothetical protein